MIGLCCDYLSAWWIWLYVVIMLLDEGNVITLWFNIVKCTKFLFLMYFIVI